MTINKVIPIVLRNHDSEILVFRHPLAGIQIVKGTVEPNESLEEAALRELYEEAGIRQSTIQKYYGTHQPSIGGPIWHIYLCKTNEELADRWVHYCADDGGLDFEFFWHPISVKPTNEWHDIFKELMEVLIPKINADSTF